MVFLPQCQAGRTRFVFSLLVIVRKVNCGNLWHDLRFLNNTLNLYPHIGTNQIGLVERIVSKSVITKTSLIVLILDGGTVEILLLQISHRLSFIIFFIITIKTLLIVSITKVAREPLRDFDR